MNTRAIAGCLAGVIVSLLIVGLVSGTALRHIIQVVPAGLAAVAVIRQDAWARYAVLPIFGFWLLIMVLIWLFLFGVAKLFSGHFTPIEIVLTIIIGACSCGGIIASLRGRGGVKPSGWILALSASLVLQVLAMWVSFQRPFVRD